MLLSRRATLQGFGLTGASVLLWASSNMPALAQGMVLDFATAGPGSGFLPYGQGVARVVASAGVTLMVRETKGSNENLSLVDANPAMIGTVFLGSAYEALNGIGPFKDRKHVNLRAIAPMYETSFQIAAKTASGISNVAGLAGTRVGVGPAGGPAEAFFKGLAEVTGMQVTIVNGTTAELEAAYLAGTIDALWQGASVPIPALRRMAEQTESRVFGLSADEIDRTLKRFPYLSPGSVAAGSYRGQTSEIRSVAAWNIIVAHKDLPEAQAHALTKAILGTPGIAEATHGAGSGTQAANVLNNRVVAYHPGAVRYLKERGLDVFAG